MNDSIQARDIWWWYWVVTFVFVAAAVLGWPPGYGVVILISAYQLSHSLVRNGSISAFPVQIRLVYLGVTLFGLWEAPRFYVFVLLLVGTFMVAALGQCGIALVLKPMPWNRDRDLQLN